MDPSISRRSMLSLSVAGALAVALPSCSGHEQAANQIQDQSEEPADLASYGYDPEAGEPGKTEKPTHRGEVPPASHVPDEWLPPVGRQTMPNCFVWASVYGLATFYAARKSRIPPTRPDRLAGPDYAYIRYEIANKTPENNCHGGQITKCLDWLQSNGGTPSLAAAPNRKPGSKATCAVEWSEYGSQPIPPNPGFRVPEYKLTHITGAQGLNNLRTVIASGVPMAFGTSLYTDFPHYRGQPTPYVGNGQVSHDRNGKKSGHVMLIVGYDDAYTKSTGAVRIQNSWGRRWGQKGFVWMAYDTLEKLAQGQGVYVPESA
ncbi:Papain family cysteine protease [Mycobacterium lentiflavum]|uniref:Papain family cysteine protease n=1 Tax=Mycobacterium lentiflavum TaxID=141349 RepID=A0A0E4H1M4_MYCLN|nr:C1 family peptidase [Mycobacterium lentiflavum]CQD20972.1 Papain family cysteine protease [Mycobacterium lentiflavum]